MEWGVIVHLLIVVVALCWCVPAAGAVGRGKMSERVWSVAFVGSFVTFMAWDLIVRLLEYGEIRYGEGELLSVVLMFFVPVVFGTALAYACGTSRKRWEERRRVGDP